MSTQHFVFDISELNQPIFSYLENINQLCQKLTKIDRIDIIVELLSPTSSTITFFHINSDTEQKGIWSKTLPPSSNFYCDLSPIPKQYNQTAYFLSLNNNIPNDFLENINNCYHIPLYWSDDRRCSLQFVHTYDHSFSSDEIDSLQKLSDLFSKNIQHLFQIIKINQDKHFFEQEHLKDHLLVKITNTAISNRDLKKMIHFVAKDMIEYFKIDYIGIILPNQEQTLQPIHSIFRLPNNKINQQNLSINLTQSFLQKIITEIPLKFHVIEQLYQQYNKNNLLAMMLNAGLEILYCQPLNLSNNQQGVLLLAHTDSTIFTSDNIHLFEHIADRLAITIDNIQSYQQVSSLNHSLVNENLYLSEEMFLSDSYREIIGQSQAIQNVLEQVEMVAESASSVLLLGETGTGKELFAKAIHQRSHRRNKRMIKINCSAVPNNLLESELFGHERGAFTNASTKRIGRFELAHGSTLLLDEIGDIPLELQPKLLRVLQEKEIERLGSNKIIPVDVRVIAATNSDLEKMVTEKTFRSDLYYRLNIFPIVIPPLRERKEDIPLLAQFFTQKLANQMKKNIKSIDTTALQQLCDYDWPGNVRELANVIERAVIITKGSNINLNMQPFLANDRTTDSEIFKNSELQSEKLKNHHFSRNDLVQREKIIQVLKQTNGIIAGPKGAAIKLGIKRTTLLSRMQKLNISAKEVLQEEF